MARTPTCFADLGGPFTAVVTDMGTLGHPRPRIILKDWAGFIAAEVDSIEQLVALGIDLANIESVNRRG